MSERKRERHEENEMEVFKISLIFIFCSERDSISISRVIITGRKGNEFTRGKNELLIFCVRKVTDGIGITTLIPKFSIHNKIWDVCMYT